MARIQRSARRKVSEFGVVFVKIRDDDWPVARCQREGAFVPRTSLDVPPCLGAADEDYKTYDDVEDALRAASSHNEAEWKNRGQSTMVEWAIVIEILPKLRDSLRAVHFGYPDGSDGSFETICLDFDVQVVRPTPDEIERLAVAV